MPTTTEDPTYPPPFDVAPADWPAPEPGWCPITNDHRHTPLDDADERGWYTWCDSCGVTL